MGTMNELLDRTAIARLSSSLRSAAPELDFAATDAAADDLGDLALRARSDLLAAALLRDLPDDYPAIAAIVRRALEQPGFRGWLIWPIGEAVTTAALADDALADGLALLAELTPRLTAEFPIRRFLRADLATSLAIITTWTTHPDEHVRRLASEGTRQYLPWAVRVPALLEQPTSTLPIITALYRDESEYVRRSVANHLNDLSRDNAALVVETAAAWLREPDANTARLVRHALRTLIKRGDPGALALLGYGTATIAVADLRVVSPVVQSPGHLEFEAMLTNTGSEPATVAVDFVIAFVKANGTHADKVFKLTTGTIEPGGSLRIAKRHPIRPITTRVYYPGEHFVDLQVNGVRAGRVPFQLAL